MKKLRITLFLLLCALLSGFPLFTWFRATTAAEIWPRSSAPKVGPKIAVEVGRVMARPAYVFMEEVMFKVDYRYACAGAWCPVYLISYCVLGIGYAGSFAFLGLIVKRSIDKRRCRRTGVPLA
jgi:hypothetical protein